MDLKNARKHSTDILFVLLLFLVFTSSALAVILLGAKVYQDTASRMESNYTVRTALAYVTEKIRHADESGAISPGELDGLPALILSQEIEGTSYRTYLYFQDGALKELLTEASREVTPEQGTVIVSLAGFSIEKTEDGFILSGQRMRMARCFLPISDPERRWPIAMHERKSSSSLFLMELIIVLFFFLLTAAICIQLFARAHSISRSSLELSHAQSLCASAAEVFSGTDGSAEAFLEKFPEGITAEQGVELFYDENFQSSGENEAKYRLTVETSSSGTDSRSAVIRFLSGDAEIYSLTVCRHIPLTAEKGGNS